MDWGNVLPGSHSAMMIVAIAIWANWRRAQWKAGADERKARRDAKIEARVQADIDAKVREIRAAKSIEERAKAAGTFGQPGYPGGPQHEGVGYAPGGIVTERIKDGTIMAAKLLSPKDYLPFADQDGVVVVGEDQAKAFAPKVRLTDTELCAETAHLFAVGSRTCVRCYQRVPE